MGILWDSLLELDELSASTNSVMELLSILVVALSDKTAASGAQGVIGSLSSLVTRLWPFLSHTISSVRHSCVKTLLALITDKSMFNITSYGSLKLMLANIIKFCVTVLLENFLYYYIFSFFMSMVTSCVARAFVSHISKDVD